MENSKVIENSKVVAEVFPATAMPDREWWSVLWPDAARIVRMLGIETGMSVVDLCCGDGYFTAPLAELVNGKVYALDIDPEMLVQAYSEVTRLGASVIKWICADAQDVAIRVPHEIDYVLIANTLHGVPDKIGLARIVAKVLKPDGGLAIINWHQLPQEQTMVLDKPRGPETELRMSPQDVRAVVEPAGFQLADQVELPPYHYGVVFRKSPGRVVNGGGESNR